MKYLKLWENFKSDLKKTNEAIYSDEEDGFDEDGLKYDDNIDEWDDEDGFFDDRGKWIEDDGRFSKEKMFTMLDIYPELRAEYDSLIDGYSSGDILRNLYYSYVLQDDEMGREYDKLV